MPVPGSPSFSSSWNAACCPSVAPTPDGYHCPISQYLIADALGLTAIHVNRVLRSLREEGVVTLRKDRVTIHDRARLMAIAGDDGADADDAAFAVVAGQAAAKAVGRQRPGAS